MTDLIQLLPDNIANQIAAGEVIQRPSSAVKELLENAVDAGADQIRLIVRDAGKSLVQVIDNGKGMSVTDARMCFERHATSKISGIDDLFRIRTMGFRGEALASIAAVAQVEMRTRREEDTLGTCIEIENSLVKSQEPCACPKGTNISMKNLFFNVPARRNFLKSNASELRHIIDEFIHVALGFPEIQFSLNSNGEDVYHLPSGTLKQRVVQVLGNGYQAKLVGVSETTDYLRITGFVGKPETARKTRGEQFLFVNQRFIRSAYLNHAVTGAYQDMIPEQSHPSYVLFLELDPSRLDINVHPTKQEIKFEDEKIVYAFTQAAVKHALARFSVTPSLDFDLDPGIQRLEAVSKPFTSDAKEAAEGGNLFQTFTRRHEAHKVEYSGRSQPWREFLEPPQSKTGLPAMPSHAPMENAAKSEPQEDREGAGARLRIPEGREPYQSMNSYVIFDSESGLVMVHQQLAHERVLYERLSEAMQGKSMATQQSLFPVTVSLGPQDAALMAELEEDLGMLGFDIEPFGGNSFLVRGTPSGFGEGTDAGDLEDLLEAYKHSNPSLELTRRERLIRAMASRRCIKAGRRMEVAEMRRLVEDLSACRQPNLSPGGSPTFVVLRRDRIDGMFIR